MLLRLRAWEFGPGRFEYGGIPDIDGLLRRNLGHKLVDERKNEAPPVPGRLDAYVVGK